MNVDEKVAEMTAKVKANPEIDVTSDEFWGNLRSVTRRLTPLECERLMGFPDGYTAIPGAKDGPRYKACGNSWAVNSAAWVTGRIDKYDKLLLGGRGIKTYATVCSGVEAQSLALKAEGIDARAVFFSEIEKFPCALLKHHYPEVKNLGDMTKIVYNQEKGVITNGTDDIGFDGQLDLFSGGTPCQDVSVAGKRAGMQAGSGTRSSLAFTFVRLCKELKPRWVLWENVPGVLSSNGGKDFAEFVHQIGELGYSVAYRTLDAQFTRVDEFPLAIPQRRRRVWLVGHLGEDWRIPAEVLFEREGVRGNTAPSRRTGQGFARGARLGLETADCALAARSAVKEERSQAHDVATEGCISNRGLPH